jgi:hypothetical protein
VAVIAGCVALVVAGAVMVVRWGGDDVGAPGAPWPPRSRGFWLLRYAGGALGAGIAAGVLAAGAGGRLVMRLLAATSPEAEGTFTEAGEVVGRISLGGTLGLVVFAGVAAGALSGALYALMRPVLPRGRAGGVAFGALLLVLAGARIEPLRPANIDFRILGPSWLAVLSFTVLGLLHGMLVAALFARMARTLPRPDLAGTRRHALLAGRVAVAGAFLVALPSFLTAVADILEA